MASSTGVTGELYDGQAQNEKTPPVPVVPVPPPSVQVAETRRAPADLRKRFADETHEGARRDVTGEALEKNELFHQSVTDIDERPAPPAPPQQEPAPPKAEAPEPPKAEVPPPPPPTQPVEKLYAGKFKTPEELEKAYQEAERAFHAKAQEAAAAKKAPIAPVRSAEEVTAENQRILQEFVSDPSGYADKVKNAAVQNTLAALAVERRAEQWRKDNPDLAPHEFFVGAEMTRLLQSDPSLSDKPDDLLRVATENFRKVTGALRTEGAKEALTTRTTVIPLTTTPANATGNTGEPAKAPLSDTEAYDKWMSYLTSVQRAGKAGPSTRRR